MIWAAHLINHVLNHENIMKNTTLEGHFAHELGNVAFQ
jgi:hypothetical protein